MPLAYCPPRRNGKVDVRKQDPYEKNEYLTYLDESSDIEDDAALQPKEETESSPKNFSRILNDSVSVWSDFNSMFFHPRSVFELGNYSHNDPIAPFAIFNQGSDIWENDHDLDDVLENRIRYFLEECDNPQGIQVLADTSNAFSGFTAACLESLRGDIGKMNITVFGISDDCDGLDPSISRLNDALALYKLSEVATIYVPLTKPVSRSPFAHSEFPGYKLNSSLGTRYQWTAALAASIDTITLPTRSTRSAESLATLFNSITASGPLAMLASAIPFPCESGVSAEHLLTHEFTYPNGESRVDWLWDDTLNLNHDFMERCSGQVGVLRGFSPTTSLAKSLNEFLAKSPAPLGRNNSHLFETPFYLAQAFPDIFSSFTPPTHVPCFSRVRSSPRLANFVRSLGSSLRGVNGRVSRMCSEAGMDKEFISSAEECLLQLARQYEED
ncbi:hypothetical protein HDU83_002225 [Entophlyctis luteolus]|nr:hypothetical protein HDU83_002225 [Entophlyctis luteolus]